MRPLLTCLWFDGNGEEAVSFYTSLFPDSGILSILRCGEAGPYPPGIVLTINFRMLGTEYLMLNGGPTYKFSPAISLMVACETQAEIDHYWDALIEGGKAHACGWLDDRFGLTWQVYPRVMDDYLSDPDQARADRVMKSMMEMVKFDLEAIERAYRGE